MEELVRKMIAGLRDTAAKVDEKHTVKRLSMDRVMHRQFGQDDVYEDRESERYTRDYIAGRLIGMADMAEALVERGYPEPGEDVVAAQQRKIAGA